MKPTTRKALAICLFVLCGLIGFACFVGVYAAGGMHESESGETWYEEPMKYHREFYAVLRWSVMLVGGVMGAIALRRHKSLPAAAFIVIAVLFNPVIPIHPSKTVWGMLNFVAFLVFLLGRGPVIPEGNPTV